MFGGKGGKEKTIKKKTHTHTHTKRKTKENRGGGCLRITGSGEKNPLRWKALLFI
jgi:hypothetical protein